MNEHAIQIERLGKRYKLGATRPISRTLGEAVAEVSRRFRGRGRTEPAPPANRGAFWALRDVSFEVDQGEVVGIVGANGAGKSTLLKVLSRITDPTEGRVRLRGRVASLLEVGTGFHPELTGRENIFLNGTVLGMRRAEIKRQFDAIVDFSEVGDFLETPVKRYSSGMRVRLAFAVAAHLQPEILIVDEVLAVGDAAFQQKCLGKMKDVGSSGRTVLFVSHNMSSVQQLCSRAVCLNKGQVVVEGAPGEVADRYLELTSNVTCQSSGRIKDAVRVRGMGERARLTACRLIGEDGRATESLRFGEAFAIEIEVEGRDQVDDLSFIAGIDTSLRQRIVTSMSEEIGLTPTVRPGERLRARLRVDDLRLVPGRYLVTIGTRSRKRPVDHLPAILGFDVLPVMADVAAPNDLWGVVQVPADWSVRSATLAEQAA